MKLTDPINIMLNCCIPDRKRLIEEISKLGPDDILRIEIDNCVTSRSLVENYVKNKWCRIVKVVEQEDSSILHIRLDINHQHASETSADV